MRLFYDSQKFPAIERKRLILSIVFGIFYSFIFYAFLCLLGEGIRLFSVFQYDIWVISDEDVSYYNFFLAFLALIFAQSICFSYWFSRTRRPFEKINIKRLPIVNDQQFLNASFLLWLSGFSILYLIFIGGGVFYVFSFYLKYDFLLILILIVLFLQIWVTIRQAYNRKSLKWMLLSTLVLTVLAFAYSKINLLDYHAINKMILEKNIAHTYKVELPESNIYEKFYLAYTEEVYIVKLPDTAESTNPLIFFKGKELSFDSLERELLIYRESDRYLECYKLYIDKSVKMSFVNQLKKVITNTGVHCVGYTVIPKNGEYDKRYYTSYVFMHLINLKSYENIDANEFDILSVSYLNDSVQINDIAYHKKDFYPKIRQQIEEQDNCLVAFSIDDEMSFADYIFVVSEYRRAIMTIRNEYAIKEYATEYEALDLEKYEIIREKIPVRLREISN